MRKITYDDLREIYSRIENMYKTIQPEKPARYSVFYSNPYSTLDKGTIYYLGLNPGGESSEEGYKDYEFESAEYWNKKPYNYSAYMPDEEKDRWGKYPCGGAPMQINTRDLLNFLLKRVGEEKNDFRTVFSTNAFFSHCKKSENLAAKLGWRTCRHSDMKDSCIPCEFWRFHQEWLGIVRPRVIVCNGNAWQQPSAYTFMRNRLTSTHTCTDFEQRKMNGTKGTYYLKGFRINNPYWDKKGSAIVIGTPHLSWFNPNPAFWDGVNEILNQIDRPPSD